MVHKHKDLLERIAQALLDRETLDAAAIETLNAGKELPALVITEENEDGKLSSSDTVDNSFAEENLVGDVVIESDPVPEEPVLENHDGDTSNSEESIPDSVNTTAVPLDLEDPEASTSN